jgi:hypothetical protein
VLWQLVRQSLVTRAGRVASCANAGGSFHVRTTVTGSAPPGASSTAGCAAASVVFDTVALTSVRPGALTTMRPGSPMTILGSDELKTRLPW